MRHSETLTLSLWTAAMQWYVQRNTHAHSLCHRYNKEELLESNPVQVRLAVETQHNLASVNKSSHKGDNVNKPRVFWTAKKQRQSWFTMLLHWHIHHDQHFNNPTVSLKTKNRAEAN